MPALWSALSPVSPDGVDVAPVARLAVALDASADLARSARGRETGVNCGDGGGQRFGQYQIVSRVGELSPISGPVGVRLVAVQVNLFRTQRDRSVRMSGG